ncbi:acid protease [Lepidopterella palustris CBS 459.81]|uniref:Acid protease n=1 Tax=Lepidopterella palustris CBS 459.81 TaxID=1314670 RepID=A0A8E2EIN2_9PEZI|nr:acid protease [Lepidopterella palustris CBS 459.81]
MAVAPRATTIPAPYVVPPSQSFDGDDGRWSTFSINVGTPGQDLRVQVSTQSGETWVIVPDGCYPEDGANCPSLRGAQPFNSASSRGFQSNISSTWSTIGVYSLDLEQKLNYTGNGLYGFDRVALGPASDNSALSLDHQIVAGVAEPDYYMGHIGLGVQPSSFSSLSQPSQSFLIQMWNQTKIPSLSYAYTAGAKYRLKSVFGSLILGGYDDTRFTPNNISFSFSNDAARLLTVGVQSIIAMNSLEGTYALTSTGHWSLIDSTVPHIWLPQDVCDGFQKAFGLTYDPTTDLYLINSTIHDKLLSLNPTITFKLANSILDTGANWTDIVLPYAAFDLQASYPIYPNATNYFPIRRAANESQYVIGRTLLQEAYLIVDHERNNFTLAQAAFPDPLPASHVVAILPSNSTSHPAAASTTTSTTSTSSLGTGAIAGIAAGGVVCLLLILIGVMMWFRRRRKQAKHAELANTQIKPVDEKPPATPSSPSHDENGIKPSELSGTQVMELGTPSNETVLGMGSGSKPNQNQYAGYHGREGLRSPGSPGVHDHLLSPEPQELPTPLNSPGVHEVMGSPIIHELEGEYYVPLSQRGSRAVSEAGERR